MGRITEESCDFVTGQGSQEEGWGQGARAGQVLRSARSPRNSVLSHTEQGSFSLGLSCRVESSSLAQCEPFTKYLK